jgi:SAM-dependent methyltransferase
MNNQEAYWDKKFQSGEYSDEPLSVINYCLGEDIIKSHSYGIDLGSGNSSNTLHLLEFVPDIHIKAVDFSQEALTQVQLRADELGIKRGQLVCEKADLGEYEIDPEQTDFVLLTRTTHLMSHKVYEHILDQLNQLGKGAILVLVALERPNEMADDGRHWYEIGETSRTFSEKDWEFVKETKTLGFDIKPDKDVIIAPGQVTILRKK